MRRLKRIAKLAEDRSGLLLLLLIAAACVAGGAYSIRLGTRLRYPDEAEYLAIARNVAETGLFSVDGRSATAWRPPGYPLLLALPTAWGFGVAALRFLNFMCLSVCLVFTFLLGGRHAGRLAGLLSCALTLCYPVALYTAGTLYPQTVATLLLVATLAVYFATGSADTFRAVLAGLLAGALVLVAPAFAFFLLFLIGWTIAAHRRAEWSPRRRVRMALVIAVVSTMTLAPWLARNYGLFGRFVFVSSNSGYNLLLGNSEHTTPNAGVNVDISRYGKQAAGMGEVERDAFFRRAAYRYMMANPGRSARLYMLKFLNYFNYRNRLYVRSESTRARDVAVLLTYVPLLALGLLRVLGARRRPISEYDVFVLLLYLLNGAFAAVFFTRIRLRLPFDVLLATVGARYLASVLLRRNGPA